MLYDSELRMAHRFSKRADVIIYSFRSDLDPFYGSSPNMYHFFLRIRYQGAAGHSSAPEHVHPS